MSEQPPASGNFRVNAHVVQMAALVLVALAIPLTLAIIGFMNLGSRPAPEPDTTVLRTIVETSAAGHLPEPVLIDDRLRVSRSPASQPEIRRLVQASAGAILEDDNRWLITIPKENAERFEAALGLQGGKGFYEMTFSQP
ncbi:MAG: hypothetical protein SFU53_15460 [Terrimicrobiaceae bacterium]|nr:hypothetical protein [Terrimicrobiaceae bacterium]